MIRATPSSEDDPDPLTAIAVYTRANSTIKKCRLVLFLLAVVSMITVVACADAPFPSDSSAFNAVVGTSMMCTSAIGVCCVMVTFHFVNVKTRAVDVTWRHMKLIESPSLVIAIVEGLLWMIHCPAGLEHYISSPKTLNALSLVRFYVVMYLFQMASPIYQFKARSLAYFSRVATSASLVFRTQMHEYPVMTSLFLYIITAAIFAVFYQLAEEVDFLTSIWFVFVTSTTVGYGDVAPITNTGRFIALLTMFFGLLGVAFIVGAVQSKMQLSPDEVALFNYLDMTSNEKLLMDDSARVLQKFWRMKKRPGFAATWGLSTAMLQFRTDRIKAEMAKRAVYAQTKEELPSYFPAPMNSTTTTTTTTAGGGAKASSAYYPRPHFPFHHDASISAAGAVGEVEARMAARLDRIECALADLAAAVLRSWDPKSKSPALAAAAAATTTTVPNSNAKEEVISVDEVGALFGSNKKHTHHHHHHSHRSSSNSSKRKHKNEGQAEENRYIPSSLVLQGEEKKNWGEQENRGEVAVEDLPSPHAQRQIVFESTPRSRQQQGSQERETVGVVDTEPLEQIEGNMNKNSNNREEEQEMVTVVEVPVSAGGLGATSMLPPPPVTRSDAATDKQIANNEPQALSGERQPAIVEEEEASSHKKKKKKKKR